MLGFLNRGASGSDLKKNCKSWSRILNDGLGVSASLGFYHSIPLIAVEKQLFLKLPVLVLIILLRFCCFQQLKHKNSGK